MSLCLSYEEIWAWRIRMRKERRQGGGRGGGGGGGRGGKRRPCELIVNRNVWDHKQNRVRVSMMLPSLMVAEFLSRCSANFVRNRVTFTCERWAEGRKIRLNDKLTVMRRKDGSRTVNKFLNRKRKEGARSVYPALHNGVNETNLCNSVISLRNSLFAEMFVPDVIVVEFRDLFESLSIYI